MIEVVDETAVGAIEAQHRQIWARCARTYADGVEALTGAASVPLLDAAGVGEGTELLDVGTGPGAVIGPALARGAAVRAVDLSEAMVAEVQTRYPGVDVRVANASALPFADATFDAVTMSFCLQHMAEPVAALAEARRVLRDGGRIALTVWAPEDRLQVFGFGFAAVGAVTVEMEPLIAVPWDTAEPDDATTLLTDVGFADVATVELDIGWDLADAGPLADLFDRFLGLAAYGPEVQEQYAAAVADGVCSWSAEAGTTFALNPALLVSGRR